MKTANWLSPRHVPHEITLDMPYAKAEGLLGRCGLAMLSLPGQDYLLVRVEKRGDLARTTWTDV